MIRWPVVSDASAAITRFRARFGAARPPTGGVPPEVIEGEVLPVLPLLAELPIEERAGEDFESFSFREVLTVLTLFGRRLALLDLTPSAAVAVVEAALDASRGDDEPPTLAFNRHARIAAIEGFVRGREERVASAGEARAGASVRPLRVDADTYALIVSGVHEPEALSDHVDALGRAMLEGNASIGIVDLSQLGEPTRDRARAVLSAEEVVRMLGARCIFSGLSPAWERCANEAHIDLGMLHVEPRLADALATARTLHDEATARSSPAWRTLLDRIRR